MNIQALTIDELFADDPASANDLSIRVKRFNVRFSIQKRCPCWLIFFLQFAVHSSLCPFSLAALQRRMRRPIRKRRRRRPGPSTRRMGLRVTRFLLKSPRFGKSPPSWHWPTIRRMATASWVLVGIWTCWTAQSGTASPAHTQSRQRWSWATQAAGTRFRIRVPLAYDYKYIYCLTSFEPIDKFEQKRRLT